jgi:probable F420-dependent oxidoreductase
VRGSTYWDPLATLSYLAAKTSTIRLATHVLVLGYHHPLEIAKRYGTLDRVSDGRLILGVGVGSLQEEFELLDAPFDDRGARADDAIRALQAAWARPEPSYAGKFYAFDGFVVDPLAVNPHTPVWVGGRTSRSLRRAVELADGWVPFAIRRADLADMINRARETEAWATRVARSDSPSFEFVLQNEHPFDPIDEPSACARRLSGWPTPGRPRSTCASSTTRSRTTSSSWRQCKSWCAKATPARRYAGRSPGPRRCERPAPRTRCSTS